MIQNIFHIDTAFAGVITDAKPVSSILLSVLNFLLSTIGVLGIIGLVVSGLFYISSAGNEERIRLAKNIAIGSVTGIVIALGALIISTTLAAFFS